MTQILVNVPDELVKQLLDLPKSERCNTLEETITTYVRKGLSKTSATIIPVEQLEDKLQSMIRTIEEFPSGEKFTVPGLLAHDNVHPDTRKLLGKLLSGEARESKVFELVGKTQANLSQYRRK
jgi:hypothetical protein